MNVTLPTVLVLEAIATGSHHGFDVMDATGLPSGSVYPILRRLEHERLVRSRWEKHEIAQREGRPPRRYYEIERAGAAWLETARLRFRVLAEPVAQPRRMKPARAEG